MHVAVSGGEWLGGLLLAQPRSIAEHRVQWQVYIDKKFGTDVWADLDKLQNAAVDAAYQFRGKTVTLGNVPDGDTWTIDVVKKLQTNARTGKERQMRRVVIVAEGPACD